MNKFFLVCPIGLEIYLKSELLWKMKLHFPSEKLELLEITHGGIEILCKAELGFALNQILRCPSKILLRIKEQKCRDLPKFYNIIKKIPWKTYLNQEEVEVKITAKKSRLIHTGRLEDTFKKGMFDYFEANKIKEHIKQAHSDKQLQNIFIRLFEDNLTISLDTSGDLLHIRGNRSFRGLASIRENMASLLLQSLTTGLEDKQYNLIDPMCGSGTFLFEWRDRLKTQQRDFAYTNLSEKYLTSELEITRVSISDNYNYYGLDISTDIIDKLKDTPDICFKYQDIFDASPITGNNIVIINPPFGKRVKIEGDKVKYFARIVEQVESLYRPIRFGIIIPRDFVGKLKGEKLYFSQNGIDVCFLIRMIKN